MLNIKNWIKLTAQPKQKSGTYDMFYLISCSNDVSLWIMEQDNAQWELVMIGNQCTYWVSEKLLTMLSLWWPDNKVISFNYEN